MDGREHPPPYDDGFNNLVYGKPYSDVDEFKPIPSAPQPQELSAYTHAGDYKPITMAPQPQQQSAYPHSGSFTPLIDTPHQQQHSPYLTNQQFSAFTPNPPMTPIIVAPQPQQQNTSHTSHVVVVGGSLPGCPVCHNGNWTGTYSCCAWLWCICCFPVGILCCLCMRKKKCTKCGYTVR